MTDKLKKLTGKNPRDFEPAAYSLINDSDVELFKELVDKDDFLFDFVKQNVAIRLEKQVNAYNYRNLLNFLPYYSPSYEDFIVNSLVKYADEDLTDRMLEIFETGSDEEKTYCARFFSIVQDPLALEFLRENAYADNPSLCSNCAAALSVLCDREAFKSAEDKLKSEDVFEQLNAVRFLVSYGDKSALKNIIEAMKTSPLAENIAIELPYLCDLRDMETKDRLLVLNLITDGLGEVGSYAQVFDFGLYEIFEELINKRTDSKTAVVLLNAREKFNTLTQNDEYLYDETQDVKAEIQSIKRLLQNIKGLTPDGELRQDSPFVYTALELTSNPEKVRELLENSTGQTVVLKSLEILKRLNALTSEDKNNALEKVTDENLRNIIKAI